MFPMKRGHNVLILTPPKSYQAQPHLKELGTESCPQRALLLFSAQPSAPTWQEELSPGAQQLASGSQIARPTSQPQIPKAPDPNCPTCSSCFAKPDASR